MMVTQLRSFIGMINFYCDVWKKHAEILAPLTALIKTPKGQKLPWNDACEESFKKIKAILVEEVLLYYPDPNKEIIIDFDASKLQLGSMIYQMDNEVKRPVVSFSCKLTPAQTHYPPSDLKALCITEVFKEFC